MLQVLPCENRSPSSGLTLPKKPVRLSRGKKSALATPTPAFAAIRTCSACRMSGRRSKRGEGRLVEAADATPQIHLPRKTGVHRPPGLRLAGRVDDLVGPRALPSALVVDGGEEL